MDRRQLLIGLAGTAASAGAAAPVAGRKPAGKTYVLVPRDPDTGAFPDWWLERRQTFIDGYRMDLLADYPTDMLIPADDTENVAWLKRRLTHHPAKQWTDELVLQKEGWEGLPRTFMAMT